MSSTEALSLNFAHPEFLWALPLVALLFVLMGFYGQRAFNRTNGLFAKSAKEAVLPLLAKGTAFKWIQLIRALAASSAVVALARPQLPVGQADIKVRGLEMVIALDLSTSMLVEDLKPSRLEFAKSELSRFLESISGDKVGLVGFAGSALLISPLTSDAVSLKMFLDSMTPRSVQTQGTDIAKALKEAAGAFQRGGVEDDDQTRSTRVIVVLSDGEDHEKEAIQEARRLIAESGVRIYTVAFGTERGGPIPIRDERGFLRGYKQDQKGQEVVSQVKGKFLEELAKEGSGTFRFATFGERPMMKLKEEIDQLAKKEIESKVAASYQELFQWFVALALLMCCLEFVVVRAVRIKMMSGRTLSLLSSFGFLLLTLGLSTGCGGAVEDEGLSLSSYFGLLRGTYHFKQERPDRSLDEYGQATVDSPRSGLTHFHYGSALFALKRPELAIGAYDQAEQFTKASDLLFQIHFNKGVILSSIKGKTDAALEEYQKALSYKPDSIETKTNIELLIQKQQRGGKGESDSESDDQSESGENEDDPNQQSKQPKPSESPSEAKKKPKPFESKDLTEQDVKRILEELKRQEDSIREKMQREGGKDSPKEKDW